MSTTDAVKLLKESSLFNDASDDFLTGLAAKMVLKEVEDGYIFVAEGQVMENIMILEEGTLMRTKLSVEEEQLEEATKSLTHARRRSSLNILTPSIVVDRVEGRGRISGMLHAVEDESKAYATVSAEGPAKVWIISGKDFREVISMTPENALDMFKALSRVLRVGSKSLRLLLQKTKTGKSPEDGTDEDRTCRVLCYDTTAWVREGFEPAIEAFNATQKEEGGIKLAMDYTTDRLSEQSVTYAAGYDAVCLFVNDDANSNVIQTLSLLGVKLIAMRCAGFDRVDTKAARAYQVTVARVPAYSPYAVAEMAIALLMSVNRKISKASNRVKMANFTLDAGLMGIDIHGKTVAVMGTGKIGQILCNIVLGFGAKLICYDVFENEAVKQAGGVYVSKDECFAQADILFLMMPLLPATRHTINQEVLPKLKKGVILINTSRGGLIDTKALLQGLRSGIISGVGMDVYENEGEYFFQDWSARNIPDPDLTALLGNNNVVLTAHQAFFTREAVDKIVSTTIENLVDFQKGLKGQAHPNNCIPAIKD